MQNIKNAFIYCQKKTKEKHWRTMNGLKKNQIMIWNSSMSIITLNSTNKTLLETQTVKLDFKNQDSTTVIYEK